MILTREDKFALLKLLHPTSAQASNPGSAITLAAGTAQIAADRNDYRHVLTIMNGDIATDLWVVKAQSLGSVAVGVGIRLTPGGYFSCGWGVADDGYLGSVYVISAGAIIVTMTETMLDLEKLIGSN